MSCFVYSQSNDIPVDFWNYVEFKNKNNNVEYDLNNYNCNVHEYKSGNVYFVNFNNQIYVITCFHIIGINNVKICCVYNSIVSKLEVFKTIEEFDIAILKFVDDTLKPDTTIYNLDDLNFKINTICKNYIINTYETDEDNQSGATFSQIETMFQQISNENIISENLIGYKFPMGIFTIPHEHKLNGLSGSIISADNMPAFMIMSANKVTKIINAFPLVIIKDIIKSFLQTSISDIPLICINTSNAELEHTPNDDENILEYNYGQYVTNTFNLKYRGELGKYFTFEIGDVIVDIDGYKFHNLHEIYDTIYGCNLKIRIFASLQLIKNKSINIKFIRNSKLISQTINGISLGDCITFNIKKTRKIVYNNGLIFTELSEDLLEYFKAEKKKFLHKSVKYIIADFKYIVLIHIDASHKYTSEINKLMEKNNVMILYKIGNDIIQNLKSLRAILEKKVENINTTYNFNNFNNFNSEDNICSIEFNNKPHKKFIKTHSN
jgi:hypothetical protein